jgi:hypothetical protein
LNKVKQTRRNKKINKKQEKIQRKRRDEMGGDVVLIRKKKFKLLTKEE